MANISRNFIKGRMNKSVDERLVPNGEYIDALNVRMGSTEGSEIGVIENSKGNVEIASIKYQNQDLSSTARCIGAFEDGAEETIYWFIHDDNNPLSPTNKVDMIVSLDTKTNVINYHVISVNDGGGANTTLNFRFSNLIVAVNKINDLLFFTDNLNEPREINVNRSYGYPLSGVDQFSDESIMVIKKPPLTSPAIQPISTSTQNNFLEDRFICFAYRYRYEDGAYSATSQFSEPAFVPSSFNYDTSTALNSGMINAINSCQITYNTGSNLVKAVELLFKDMDNSIIKIIEQLDKDDLGLADNTDYTYNFSNSKIFTILPDSEILRLYDNVPRLAQAQTIMSNRLVYGNYVEGYDLIDKNGAKTKLEYFTELSSEDIGFEQVEFNLGDYVYNFSCIVPASIQNSVIYIDLSGKDLIAGSSISILINIGHSTFTCETPFPSQTTEDEFIDFTYYLTQDFSSVYELATSNDFLEKIGTLSNIQTVADSCNGTTLTDQFNCTIPVQLGNLYKYESGINNPNEPIAVLSNPSSDSIGLVLPTMKFVDDPTGVNITQTVFEYYLINSADITFKSISNPTSLHSNRGYEIGLIYMDEFNRMSSPLVSPNNTVHVPCRDSRFKNTIDVTIPTQQIAPAWATRYKFAIKPDKENYDVIYSNFFFRDPSSGYDYFLLDGENSRKIEEGDQLIVKSDTSGATQACVWTTVLEKTAKSSNFLDPKPIDSSGNEISIPAGTYMRLKANNFNTDTGDLPVIDYGDISDNTDDGGCKEVYYPVAILDPNNPGSYIDYTIPSGARISIRIVNEREGNEDSLFGNVSRKYWAVDTFFFASQNYSNFKAWFEGDNIALALEALSSNDGTDVEGPNYSPLDPPFATATCNVNRVYTGFYTISGRTHFAVKSSEGYNGDKKSTKLSVHIEVIRSNSTIVFESDPQDAQPDLWYESSDSFPINSDGEHSGNVQDQDFTAGDPAIVKTDFFNCFSFGNGVESYKIEDSIVGKSLALGNRVTTTQSKEYKEVRRFADLTYSSIYNQESNINKLNEFNLGLLNYKLLEQIFGPVRKLFARETDILTLQEDRISYVLAGKNILSDATGGSALTSVPEVLGTQIARVEEFGISNNPESFVQWGSDKYFTDTKRGSVIKLSGAGQGESLNVISMMGMRTWFRDLFIESPDTQKLGGFDPYMNEYVLSSNNIKIPSEEQCISCGTSRTITVKGREAFSFCNSLGELVGDVNIVYNVISNTGTFEIVGNYDGTLYTTGPESESGVLTFYKGKVNETSMIVNITTTGEVTLEVTVQCPNADDINIVLVQVSSDADESLTIHDEYRWVDQGYQSPLHSQGVVFNSGVSPVVSLFQQISGPQGAGIIPSNTAVVTMISNKFKTDTYDFDVNKDRLRYLRTDTVYNNNASDINALLLQSNSAGPISPSTSGAGLYSADFNMPSSGSNLYLIWDYRVNTPLGLCYSETIFGACCGCEEPTTTYYLDGQTLSDSTRVYLNPDLTIFAPDGYYSDGTIARRQFGFELLPEEPCPSCE